MNIMAYNTIQELSSVIDHMGTKAEIATDEALDYRSSNMPLDRSASVD